MSEFEVELKDVTKRFGDVVAVDHVSLQIEKGEFVSLLGPSGCGKTTTLRIIAGFEEPTSGDVLLGKNMKGIPPYKRPVNTVFQNYALFPHMNVYENVAFGPRRAGVPKSDISQLVKNALALVGLEEYGLRYPKQLSGGQQQRVALSRALVNKPRVLLLDEPLGALDLKLRKQMQLELKRLQQQIGICFIYVTHDQEEALSMSDRIVVMNRGKIAQVGSGQEIYENPNSKFVADFIGETNVIPCRISRKKSRLCVVLRAEESISVCDLTDYVKVGEGVEVKVGENVEVSVRPEKVFVSKEPVTLPNVFTGRVKGKIYLGSKVNLYISLSEGITIDTVHRSMDVTSKLDQGDTVNFGWRNEDVKVLRG